MRRLSIIAFAVVCGSLSLTGVAPAPAGAAPAAVVVPNALTSTNGNSNNVFPFGCGALFSSQRYQQVYAAAQVGSGSISQIAFRAKFSAIPPTAIPNVTITLSTTPKDVAGLDTTFARNIGQDVKTVFSGTLTVSSAGGGSASAPGPFDMTIALQSPFTFNAASGNLLMDVTIPTCMTTDPLDADFQSPPPPVTIGRVYTAAGGSSSPTGQNDNNQFGGLVTQFTLGAGPTNCVSGSHGSVALGPGATCVNNATVNGSLVIPAGGTVTITNSTISGSVTGNNIANLSLCGSTVGGSVGVTGASGFVLIGDPTDDACAGNTINGSVTLNSVNHGVEISHNVKISGSVSLGNDHGGGPLAEDSSPEIEANTIGNGLSCTGDTPAAINDGQPNAVGGTRSGECGSPGF